MRAAQPLLAKGLFGRTFEELKRRTTIASKLEAVKGPSGPRPLYDWQSAAAVQECVVMSDNIIGGESGSQLDFVTSAETQDTASTLASSASPLTYARFHGNISTALPADKENIKRSGYAGFRTPNQSPTLLGRSFWDIDPYSYLAIRFKSDGRAYFINIQTESIEPTDLHQHRLFSKRPGEWETVLIKWNDFVRTSYGFVTDPQNEILRQKVKTFGVGLTDRVVGPFEFCIERIWATNDKTEGRQALESGESNLKTRGGARIHW